MQTTETSDTGTGLDSVGTPNSVTVLELAGTSDTRTGVMPTGPLGNIDDCRLQDPRFVIGAPAPRYLGDIASRDGAWAEASGAWAKAGAGAGCETAGTLTETGLRLRLVARLVGRGLRLGLGLVVRLLGRGLRVGLRLVARLLVFLFGQETFVFLERTKGHDPNMPT